MLYILATAVITIEIGTVDFLLANARLEDESTRGEVMEYTQRMTYLRYVT